MTFKQNEPMSALTHLIGALLGVAGLVLLIIMGAIHGSAWHVVSFSVFGSFIVLAYVMSTIYHYICSTNVKLKRVWQIFDHIAIYFLIAGTYTPVALVVLSPGWGWAIFGVIWACAIIGTIIKATQMKIPVWFSVLLYLVMGWMIVIAFVPLTKALSGEALFWLVLGGCFYTIGALFFSLDKLIPRTRWFGMHEVFHVFVMLGSFSHFWLFYKYVTFL